MKRKHLGTHSELRAVLWLLEQGYEVFKNVSAHGPMDIIAIKDGEMLKLDVKSAISVSPNAALRLKPEQEAEGVKALLVKADGSFEIRDTKAWCEARERWPKATTAEPKSPLWI